MFRLFRALTGAISDLVATLKHLNPQLEDIASELRRKGPAIDRLDELERRQTTWEAEMQASVATVTGPPIERLAELERRQALWEAEMQALVATATGKYEAANNAESRTRTMKKHYEKLVDPFDEKGEEVAEALRAGDAARGEDLRLIEAVPPVRVDVAADPKTEALRYKFS